MIVKLSFIFSIIIHVVILSATFSSLPKPTQPQSKMRVQIKSEKLNLGSDNSKEDELFVINELNKMFEEMDKVNKQMNFIKKLEHYVGDCDDFYIGIGITHEFISSKISRVVPNGPADKAGLKVGDAMLNSNLNIKDTFPIGTSVNIVILRNGITTVVPIKVDKICIRKIKSGK